MNFSLIQIMLRLPALIAKIELVIQEKNAGADKLQAILQAVLQMVPTEEQAKFLKETWPNLKTYIDILVELYKVSGFFK